MTYININRKSLSSLKTMFGVGLPVKKHCQNTTSRADSGGTRLPTRVPFEGHTVSKSLNLATIEIWPWKKKHIQNDSFDWFVGGWEFSSSILELTKGWKIIFAI